MVFYLCPLFCRNSEAVTVVSKLLYPWQHLLLMWIINDVDRNCLHFKPIDHCLEDITMQDTREV